MQPADARGLGSRGKAVDAEAGLHALWSLGFAGDVESAEVLVQAISDEKTAKVAGEAFSAGCGRCAWPRREPYPATRTRLRRLGVGRGGAVLIRVGLGSPAAAFGQAA